MAMGGSPMGHGTMLAIGVVLLWFGGLCMFIAFMSGKVPSMQVGTTAGGKAVGPRDVSDVVSRIAASAQALEGNQTAGS